MTLHQSRKKSLYVLSRELEKIAQLSVLTGMPIERQSLARYAWNDVAGFNQSSIKDVPKKTFNRFLAQFTSYSSDTRMELCPTSYARITRPHAYAQGTSLLNKAGIDIQSLDVDLRENICDFICAVEAYHDEVHAKKSDQPSQSFSKTLAAKKPLLQRSLLNYDIDAAVDSFVHELMNLYLPDFDFQKITFSNSKKYDNVIYGDPSACKVLKSLQSTLKFDLKSLGIDTISYHEAQDIADTKRKTAESILSSSGATSSPEKRERVQHDDFKNKGSFLKTEP